ncbi:MAG: MlaD family protein [Pseudomonadota bacterium]|uniref:MlaD family protein n=1 Tax=Caldimonas aquatica TaxID=376175 RepID=A0ABY6MTE5_9BURK|nr:MlaD family protein [Schlegelella aquatica]UZD55251.1 MlaD family protein [Schlegelella aquatica]
MKRNALLVGTFVIGALALVVFAIVSLGGGDPFQQRLRAVIYFHGSVSGLYVGAPVTFRGVPVGQVESIGVEFEQGSLDPRIPVRVRLQSDAIRVAEPGRDRSLALPELIRRGLRARLVAQSFVTGQKFIDLDFLPDQPARMIGRGREPEIPAVADRFGALIEQVAELPLRETVADLRNTLQALQTTLATAERTLQSSSGEIAATAQETRRMLVQAGRTLQELQASAQATLGSVTRLADSTRETVQDARPELQQGLRSAREAAEAARVAMTRVQELTATGTPLRADLDAAVRDLSQAARGLREWSELLQEQPNAVIFGSDR